MNFTKVFRRQHNHKEVPDKPSYMHHHGYPRPFSYHIPPTEQSSPLNKPSQSIPYRVGLSSDSTILTHANNQDIDEIVRLPSKPARQISPKHRKDRRHHGQLTANKRWLFRSMEALDEWKGKVFSPKIRTNKFVTANLKPNMIIIEYFLSFIVQVKQDHKVLIISLMLIQATIEPAKSIVHK